MSQGWDILFSCSLKQPYPAFSDARVIGRTCLQRLSLKMLHAKDLHEEVYFALSFGQFKSICCEERDVHSKGVSLHDVIYDTSVL